MESRHPVRSLNRILIAASLFVVVAPVAGANAVDAPVSGPGVAAIAGSSPDDLAVQTQASRAVVAVSVPLRTVVASGGSGQNGIIQLKVGSAPSIPVMLDTGSVGLRIWGNKPPGSTVGSTPISTQLGGKQIPGYVGSARVTIGGVTTAVAVPFQLINSSNSWVQGWKKIGVVGILGIGVGAGDLTNPLVALPGTLGMRWSVHIGRLGSNNKQTPGALILGAQPASDSAMRLQLPPAGADVNGAKLWNDHEANGCWKFGVAPEQCMPTWLDSGFTKMTIVGRRFANLPTDSKGVLKSGTPISVAAGSSASYGLHFVAGTTGSQNLTQVIARGKESINTGNTIFFDHTVTYDASVGKIFVATPATSAGKVSSS